MLIDAPAGWSMPLWIGGAAVEDVEPGPRAITDEQTGAPTFGYPAKDQRELAAECRRLKSMLET